MLGQGPDVMRFVPTPPTPGTGWFDRGGIERRPQGGGDRPTAIVARCCTRCGGAGGAKKWDHTGWRCFDCSGTGHAGDVAVKLYTAAQLVVLDERRDARRAKVSEERRRRAEAQAVADEAARATREQEVAADPFHAELRAYAPRSEFLADLAEKMRRAPLSPRQIEAAQTTIAKMKVEDDKTANSRWLGEPGERITVVGTVVFVKVVRQGAPRYTGRFPADELDKCIVKIETDDHQFIVVFTTKSFAEGDRVNARATVVEQKVFRDRKEVEVTRLVRDKVKTARAVEPA